MTALGVCLSVIGIFSSYCIGNLIGYKDCINHEEKKKGIKQNSRCLWNWRF